MDANEMRDTLLDMGVTDAVNEMWDTLLDMGVSEETLQVVTSINGYNTDTMEDVLYVVFGERTFDNNDEEEDY